MNDVIIQVFGEGKELEWWQITDRAIAMFFIALILVRISGRRSFGMKTPFDNTITILLGAILSRGVVGASPFFSVTVACLVMVLLHRSLAWLVIHNKAVARLVRGEPIELYKDGQLQKRNMDKSLICEEELHENVRIKANVEGYEKVAAAWLETNGEIGVVKKEA